MAAYAIMSNLRLAEQEHFELFHIYYQPLLVMLAMLWMWSMDVRAFEQRRIAYSVCFSPQDQQYLLSSQQLFQVRNHCFSNTCSFQPLTCLDVHFLCKFLINTL